MLNEKNLTCYGGNGDHQVLRSILSDFCSILTGYRDTQIKLETEFYTDKNGNYMFPYHLQDGPDYQYNDFYLDQNFKLIKVDGDGKNQIEKLIAFVEYWDYNQFMKWHDMDIISDIAYGWDCADRDNDTRDLHIRIGKRSKAKFMEMNKIHQKLLIQNNEEIKKSLDLLYHYWDNNFTKSGFLDTIKKGDFKNFDVPKIKLANPKPTIFFPGESRGEICSEFLVTPDFNKIIKKKIGDKIVLQNIRKGSKVKEYEILEHKGDWATAVKGPSGLEFITDQYAAESCYDALFTCNRIEFRGWFNKRCKLVESKT